MRRRSALLSALAALLVVPSIAWAGPIVIDVVRLDGVGTDELWRDSDWFNDFTALVTFEHNGDPHLLAYNRHTGTITFDRIEPNGEGLVFLGIIDSNAAFANYTSVATFELAGRAHFLFYSKERGDLDIYRIRADAAGLETVAQGVLDTGWTLFMPFELNGQPHYAGFKESTREFLIHRIGSNGEPKSVWYNQWTTPWTSFTPFVHNGQPHFFTYQRETGVVTIQRVNAGGLGTTELKRYPANASNSGQTARASFELNGRPHYFTYSLSTGGTSIIRIGLDGVTLEPLWGNDPLWPTGLTAIAPFVFEGRPHLISYKGSF